MPVEMYSLSGPERPIRLFWVPGIYLLCASNPMDEVVLEGAGNNAVCSGLPHSVAFDGHLSQRNMHLIVWMWAPWREH